MESWLTDAFHTNCKRVSQHTNIVYKAETIKLILISNQLVSPSFKCVDYLIKSTDQSPFKCVDYLIKSTDQSHV